MVKHPQPDLYGKTSSEMSSITCEYLFRRIRFSLRHNLWMVFFSSNWRQRHGIPQIVLHKYSLKPISNGFSLKCVFLHWFREKIEYLRLWELHLQIALASIVIQVSSKSRKILWLVSFWPVGEEVLEMRSHFGVKGTTLFSFASIFHPKILTLTKNAEFHLEHQRIWKNSSLCSFNIRSSNPDSGRTTAYLKRNELKWTQKMDFTY